MDEYFNEFSMRLKESINDMNEWTDLIVISDMFQLEGLSQIVFQCIQENM